MQESLTRPRLPTASRKTLSKSPRLADGWPVGASVVSEASVQPESAAASMNPSPSSSAPFPHSTDEPPASLASIFRVLRGFFLTPSPEGSDRKHHNWEYNSPDDGQNAVAHGVPSQHEYPLVQTAKQESPFTQTVDRQTLKKDLTDTLAISQYGL
jgi:hypothetical protein